MRWSRVWWNSDCSCKLNRTPSMASFTSPVWDASILISSRIAWNCAAASRVDASAWAIGCGFKWCESMSAIARSTSCWPRTPVETARIARRRVIAVTPHLPTIADRGRGIGPPRPLAHPARRGPNPNQPVLARRPRRAEPNPQRRRLRRRRSGAVRPKARARILRPRVPHRRDLIRAKRANRRRVRRRRVLTNGAVGKNAKLAFEA